MKNFLRVTRKLVTLAVSLHILALRLLAQFADKQAAKASARVAVAQKGVQDAQDQVRYARLNVREFKDKEIIANNDARNTRVACEQDAKQFGRSL